MKYNELKKGMKIRVTDRVFRHLTDVATVLTDGGPMVFCDTDGYGVNAVTDGGREFTLWSRSNLPSIYSDIVEILP